MLQIKKYLTQKDSIYFLPINLPCLSGKALREVQITLNICANFFEKGIMRTT